MSRVLFIGNLSYFCEEQHLWELFSEYGCVEAVRVVQNVEKTKSLMYGFITMSSNQEAAQMVDLLDGHLFMGRKIKVDLSSANGKGPQGKNRAASDNHGCQIHVSFYSFFDNNSMILPTELYFRKVFLGYGKILDIVIKDFVIHNNQPLQEGYAFITFANHADAYRVSCECVEAIKEGITLRCTLAYGEPTGPPPSQSQRVMVPPVPMAYPPIMQQMPMMMHDNFNLPLPVPMMPSMFAPSGPMGFHPNALPLYPLLNGMQPPATFC